MNAVNTPRTKSKIAGIILTVLGMVGLAYAAVSQFTDGMDKQPIAGFLLFSLIVIFVGVGQFYKKHPDDY